MIVIVPATSVAAATPKPPQNLSISVVSVYNGFIVNAGGGGELVAMNGSEVISITDQALAAYFEAL